MRGALTMAVFLAACTGTVTPSTASFESTSAPTTTGAATTSTVNLVMASEDWFSHLVGWQSQ